VKTVPYVHLSTAEGKPAPGRIRKLAFSPTDAPIQTRQAMAGASIIFPRTETDCHAHAECEEIMYIASGRGEAQVGKEHFDIQPDMMIYVPTGASHSLKNTSDEMMKIIFVFVPT